MRECSQKTEEGNTKDIEEEGTEEENIELGQEAKEPELNLWEVGASGC